MCDMRWQRLETRVFPGMSFLGCKTWSQFLTEDYNRSRLSVLQPREGRATTVTARVRYYVRRTGTFDHLTQNNMFLSILRCKKCKGEKVVQEKTRQEVHVERGMSDGQRIVLAGAGDQEVSAFYNTPPFLFIFRA